MRQSSIIQRVIALLCIVSLMLLSLQQALAATITKEYYHHNHQGSPIGVYDGKGNELLIQRWTPWGERQVLKTSAPASSTGALLKHGLPAHMGYTGHKDLVAAGLVFMGDTRLYSPKLKRFPNPDDRITGGIRGENRSSYAYNNPVRRIDPDGHAPIVPYGGGGPVVPYRGGLMARPYVAPLVLMTAVRLLSSIRFSPSGLVFRTGSPSPRPTDTPAGPRSNSETTVTQSASNSPPDIPESPRIVDLASFDKVYPQSSFKPTDRFTSQQLQRRSWWVYRDIYTGHRPNVIGRLQDIKAGEALGFHRLNTPVWSQDVNNAWIQGGIDGKRPFYLGSNPDISNYRSPAQFDINGNFVGRGEYPETLFFKEMKQLRDAGYYRQGFNMLPPNN